MEMLRKMTICLYTPEDRVLSLATMRSTQYTIYLMQSCPIMSCSSSLLRSPYGIWRRRQHSSHLKSNQWMQVLLEHMTGSGGVGWEGCSSWPTQTFALGSSSWVVEVLLEAAGGKMGIVPLAIRLEVP